MGLWKDISWERGQLELNCSFDLGMGIESDFGKTFGVAREP